MKSLLVLSLFCYFLAMLKFILHLAVRKQFFYLMAAGFSALGFILHTVMFFQIAAQTGHGPYTNAFEYASFFAWTTMAVLIVFVFFFRVTAVGAFVSPLAFLLMAYSMLLPDSTVSEGAQVKAFWLTMHYTVSFLALSAFIVVFAASVMYLLQERQLKHRQFGAIFQRMPDLETLDLLLHRSLLFGFPLITVGVISGMIWTSAKFGTLLGPQPLKVVPIIVVWIVYALLMGGRTFAGWRGHTIAKLGVTGFVLAVAGLGIHLF